MLEYPDDAPRLADINDGNGLSLLPITDVREDLTRVISEASLEQLRAAWHTVHDRHCWAIKLCDDVEAELDLLEAGQAAPDYPALRQWRLGVALGLNRMLLREALREPEPSTRERASTAVTLLYLATGMSRLRVMVPDSQFHLLPMIMPPFLYQLTTLVAADPPASIRRPESR